MGIIEIAAKISAEMRAGTFRTNKMILNGFFRCQCGKVHTYGGLGPSSACTCGVKLWDYTY